MPSPLMQLKVLLPSQIFADKTGVSRIVAETREGSFGLLPHRLDCVAALVPGILTYETQTDGEVFVAVDEGILVKTGSDVLVSVRRAHAARPGPIARRRGKGVLDAGRRIKSRPFGDGQIGNGSLASPGDL
jgi:F0F1-type ATP synthase epsilon subunit